MKLFKVPTRAPEVYDADTHALRQRVRELEEVVEKYRTKRVGPYVVTVEISGPDWHGIAGYLKWMGDVAQEHGPDHMMMGGGDSGGYSFKCDVKSNTEGGHGETKADIADDNAPDPTPPIV